MIKKALSFCSLLLIVMLVVFAAHVLINKKLFDNLYANSVVLSYIVNYVIAISVFILLICFLPKIKSTLGFFFMAGSFVKFLIFFIVFQPIFKSDGVMSKAEFASFFVPYALSLILEVYFLSKILNRSDD